ncbi:class I SAM-dependent methyltransferase [Pseudofrancisella aestuarii]|uniref:Class I SAM-dependent methyltransferase n=1 Tax=Pseudofrancisella aestuarii TaxID=2670347 RepID=A0ABV9TCX9_9GAMM|nr:class I SAM-dependent methyltransferase [Pseudofrancisella aestuarii]
MGKKILEDGIPAGNWENKYNSKNPIVNYLMNNFKKSILKLLEDKLGEINSFSECGCGEGEITRYIYEMFGGNIKTKAFDFSEKVVEIAKKNNSETAIKFEQISIYDMDDSYSSDLIVCCEVLEHLEHPERALQKMRSLQGKYYLFSVPNEPIWRVLNFCRGKYIKNFGNTPGHINHWSTKSFQKLIKDNGFKIIEINNPFPWNMLLAEVV